MENGKIYQGMGKQKVQPSNHIYIVKHANCTDKVMEKESVVLLLLTIIIAIIIIK